MRFRLFLLLGLMAGLSGACAGAFPESDGSAASALLLSLGVSSGSPGIAITQTDSSTSVSEAGLTDTYTIVLNSQPADPVTVTITFDGTQISVNGSTSAVTLTFDATCPGTNCWSDAQTVTIAGVNNTTIETTNTTHTITHTLSSGDSNYAGMISTVDVSLLDNSLTFSVSNNPSNQDESIDAIAIDANYIYVAGGDFTPGNFQWRIEKRDIITGELVTSFGTNGVVTTNPSTSSDLPNDIAVDANFIYIVGFDRVPGNDQWRIEKRDINTGALVTAFDTDGIIQVNPAVIGDRAVAVAIDAVHIYIGGYDLQAGSGNRQWRIEKRNKTTGVLIGAFGTTGVVQSNPTIRDDEINDIVLDGTDLYVVGFQTNTAANSSWRIERRSATTGALNTAFNTTGFVNVDHSAFADAARYVIVDGTSIYVSGSDRIPGSLDAQWRIEKRDRNSGALDGTFNAGAPITVNISVANDFANAMALDSTRLYVAGVDKVFGNNRWNIYAYNFTTGVLDTTFDGDGILQIQYDLGAHVFNRAFALDGTYFYMGGADGTNGEKQWRLEKRIQATGAVSF